ncbi:uncharacterized protein LACBIDRAFT_334964 [Laccaria bicolor S238N-H82]|uniref:Predicted protein n=1 Tax=Laccaria bicolor (strain S238N-H82 / ATCC MYA-4686) TaxID=486041 RepID=B0E0W9_LACBS|nr:uncharacterized protein LACBIDRAFT_334964 [Laccaria bicolor S238N-H82]EDQ99472.1 predicted protein [Laccaria bicolor S238N-H82]|eukprot:XP_001889821.1 predicted protein [Laccaria bicolor S238N-H82]
MTWHINGMMTTWDDNDVGRKRDNDYMACKQYMPTTSHYCDCPQRSPTAHHHTAHTNYITNNVVTPAEQCGDGLVTYSDDADAPSDDVPSMCRVVHTVTMHQGGHVVKHNCNHMTSSV